MSLYCRNLPINAAHYKGKNKGPLSTTVDISAQPFRSVFCWHNNWKDFIKQTVMTLIRLGRCPIWSGSSLFAHENFWIFPCTVSQSQTCKHKTDMKKYAWSEIWHEWDLVPDRNKIYEILMKSSNTGYTVLCLFPIFYFIVRSDFSVRQCNPFAMENESCPFISRRLEKTRMKILHKSGLEWVGLARDEQDAKSMTTFTIFLWKSIALILHTIWQVTTCQK